RDSGIYDVFDPYLDSNSAVLEEDSPYPEVRSAVANFDDSDMPVATLRAWVIGLIWAAILPGMNQIFHFRYPSVAITGLVAQLLVFPLGRMWARMLPVMTVLGIQINPGPFSIKEHVLVTIMASVGVESAYATDIIAVQRVYYNEVWSFAYQWMLFMSTQLIGFSIGGLGHRFLVAPASMIWPNTLVSCALFNTLHSQSYAGIGQHEGMSRERYFLYAFFGALAWYFVPGYLFQALSIFSWVCWLAPNNVTINQLFGYHSGLGFSILTFDWNQIAYIGSPLASPWWAEANVMFGFFLFYWLVTPVLYYSNVWHSQYLPMSSADMYDNTGNLYDLVRILNNQTTIQIEAYQSYSPVYLSITFVMSYGLSFLSISGKSCMVHSIIHFWTPIRRQIGRSSREPPDVHAHLMARYPRVPEWYYGIIFALTFILACVCTQLWPTGFTIWSLVISLIMGESHLSMRGMIQAITNRQIGLNVISELVVGFMIPGKLCSNSQANAHFSLAVQFTADFKLGHYMKVPPRPMFWCQIAATIVAGTAQLGVQTCASPSLNDFSFTCQSTHVFGIASVIWGVIGPDRQFTKGQMYYRSPLIALTVCFLVGAACPVIQWLITRRYPNTISHYLHLVFSGLGLIPPATSINYVPWAIVGFVFQYLIRRRRFSYWTKYNYVLSAALDSGTALGVIVVFFCLQYYHHGSLALHWWGNQVHKNTLDWGNTPFTALPPGQTFGCVLESSFFLDMILLTDLLCAGFISPNPAT
ncbi:small oligopeptide transporter, partial [Tricholoma matsutake]